MWRSILAVVLLPTIVWGQEQSLPVPAKQETVATEGTRPTYRDRLVMKGKAAPLVVDRDTTNHPNRTKALGGDAGGTPILIWILAPLLIPLMVVMAIVCGISGQDCSC